MGRCGDNGDQAYASSFRVAGTPCQDAGPQTSQDVPLWMATLDTAPRRRWRDLVKKDLKAVRVGGDWYSVSQDRGQWRSAWSQNLAEHQAAEQRGRLWGEKNVLCDVCGRRFRREGDKARHKCAAERRRPVCEQEGAVQCGECRRWFRSRGGLAVHRCRREQVVEDGVADGAQVSQGQVECRECGRTFSRPGDLKRHKCRDERSRPVQEQRGSLQCPTCERWFKSAGGLSVHRKRTCSLPREGHVTQMGSG